MSEKSPLRTLHPGIMVYCVLIVAAVATFFSQAEPTLAGTGWAALKSVSYAIIYTVVTFVLITIVEPRVRKVVSRV